VWENCWHPLRAESDVSLVFSQNGKGEHLSSQPGQPDDAAERRFVVEAPPDALILVEAGPGTGKTELAAKRLASLLANGTAPAELLILSFSRSAVRTLTKRLGRLNNVSERVQEELRYLSIRGHFACSA
jgi:DNA helicase-2/ATP-dependent DNA helicase PcrA